MVQAPVDGFLDAATRVRVYGLADSPVTVKEIGDARSDANVSLGTIALNRGFLTSVEIKHILETQSATGQRFGQAAIDLELLGDDQLRELLDEQEKINFDAGEILVLKGLLSPDQLKEERRAFERRKKD